MPELTERELLVLTRLPHASVGGHLLDGFSGRVFAGVAAGGGAALGGDSLLGRAVRGWARVVHCGASARS